MDLEQLTAGVCKIAAEGGKYLTEQRTTFDKDRIEEKDSHDYVSYVDKETEKILVKRLHEILPGAGFVTEEQTVKYEEHDYCWIIDPLDGTTNFIYDNPPYSVSIALRYKNEIVIGVVYEVTRAECFYAWKDGGSYLNGKKLNVSKTFLLDKASVGIDLPYNYEKYKPVVNRLVDYLYGKAASVRLYGSAAVAICYVAAGRFDIWAEAFVQLWDYAAGAIIVTEAGGKITDFNGNGDFLGGHHIIVSNGTALHEEIKNVLVDFSEKL